MINAEVLHYFYSYNGIKKEFNKLLFIRLIRNKIIDKNTAVLLSKGFNYVLNNNKVLIPCDDCNWCEYNTINEGFKENILNFPFTLKFYHDDFQSINNYNEYKKLFNEIIKFRIDTIKCGWALKYGLEYNNIEYDVLEDLNEKQLLNFKDPRLKVNWQLEDITKKNFD